MSEYSNLPSSSNDYEKSLLYSTCVISSQFKGRFSSRYSGSISLTILFAYLVNHLFIAAVKYNDARCFHEN